MPYSKYILELEINGENVDDEEEDDLDALTVNDDDDVEGADVPEDGDLEDFSDETFDGEETPESNEESEPATDDNAETEEPESEESNPAEDTPADGTAEPTGEDVEGGADGTDIPEDDDLEDFTDSEYSDDSEDGTGDGGGDETGDSAEGEDGTDDTMDTGDEDQAGDDASEGGDDLASMEKNLFSDLTPQQMAIKNTELLNNYIELYESIDAIFTDVNKIPKTFNNTRALEFIGEKLVELKTTVNYIITTTYIARTYAENMGQYQQCLVILQQINTMLKGLVQKPAK